MALEEEVMNQQPEEQAGPERQTERLTDEEEDDLKIAVLLTERMLSDNKYQVIQDALQSSSDPAQVIGQFMIQLIKKLDESMPNGAKLSKRIWLCKGGWLEQIMDHLVDELGIDYAVTDKAEVYVADTVMQMAKAGQQGAEPAPQPGAPSPMPGAV